MELLRQEYPRPQFRREEWIPLNGEWRFAFDDQDQGLNQNWQQTKIRDQVIRVPFAYQSELSGIGDKDVHPVLWYQRELTIPSRWQDKRTILNFNAVDYQTTVWVNGKFVGTNKGGYVAFSFDISRYLLTEGENTVTLRVEDYPLTSQPRGKQSARSDSWACWYTPVSGIWQSVWLEAVGETNLDHLKMEPDIDYNQVNVTYFLDRFRAPLTLKYLVKEGDLSVAEETIHIDENFGRFSNLTPRRDGSFSISLPHAKLWSPESPHLYDLTVSLYQAGELVDKVHTYFGMRKIHSENGKVYLNNQPYYLRMVLDQGYWPKGIYTPQSVTAIRYDVEMTKQFGFNGARKHQKFEDPYYYYYCDKLGLLTWCEMAACYHYEEEVSFNIIDEWQRLIVRHYNFPSVMAWVPINESWGVDQLTRGSTDPRLINHLKTVYYLTKSIDPTRLVVGNDGWQQADTDIIAIHDYTQDANDLQARYSAFKRDRHSNPFSHGNKIILPGHDYHGQPIMITEFGGVKVREQAVSGWGYGEDAKDYREMLERIGKLVAAIEAEEEICGYCYTQLTDVQQEVNGLMTYERHSKVEPTKIAHIFSPK